MSKKYTAEERRQIAKAFKGAKKRLWDGKGEWINGHLWICNALNYSQAKGNLLAKEVIRGRLGMFTVRTWLRLVAKIPAKQLTLQAVQEYRHRWLDALIEEFSK